MKRLTAIEGETEGASDGASAFSQLISPLTPKRFFADDWDTQCVHIAGDAGRFDTVLSATDFCNAMFTAELDDRRVRYLQKSLGNKHQSQSAFLKKKIGWDNPPTLGLLANQFRTGTFVFDLIDNRVPSLKAWCRRLYPDVSSRISANAYFSAGRDASAFDAHFDEQDVFILQLEGEKEWQLWTGKRVPNPSAGHPQGHDEDPPTLPADEIVTLTAGDVLYVPRGTWHWPRSLDDTPSLHLTVALVMPQPADVLRWLKEQVYDDAEMRAGLPLSPHQDSDLARTEMLDAVFAKLELLISDPRRRERALAYLTAENIRTLRDQSE